MDPTIVLLTLGLFLYVIPAQIHQCRNQARQMGEAYSVRQGMADTMLLWVLIPYLLNKLCKSGVLPWLNPGYLSLGWLMVFLAALYCGSVGRTSQKYVQWKISQEQVEDPDRPSRTLIRLRDRKRWLPWIITGFWSVMVLKYCWLDKHKFDGFMLLFFLIALWIMLRAANKTAREYERVH